MSRDRTVLASGCFWGAQELLRKKPGLISTRAGYSGGNTPNATYHNHGDHYESVEIVFDPDVISFRDLLEFLFQIHDPSTRDRQGNDVGRSYRSAIFYTSDEQREVALDTIKDVDASGLWPGKVVTEVEPAGDFWESRGRAPGLPPEVARRLYLPLRPPRLEAPAPREPDRVSLVAGQRGHEICMLIG